MSLADRELRLECLRLANSYRQHVGFSGSGAPLRPATDVVSDARAFFDFATGKSVSDEADFLPNLIRRVKDAVMQA